MEQTAAETQTVLHELREISSRLDKLEESMNEL